MNESERKCFRWVLIAVLGMWLIIALGGCATDEESINHDFKKIDAKVGQIQQAENKIQSLRDELKTAQNVINTDPHEALRLIKDVNSKLGTAKFYLKYNQKDLQHELDAAQNKATEAAKKADKYNSIFSFAHEINPAYWLKFGAEHFLGSLLIWGAVALVAVVALELLSGSFPLAGVILRAVGAVLGHVIAFFDNIAAGLFNTLVAKINKGSGS